MLSHVSKLPHSVYALESSLPCCSNYIIRHLSNTALQRKGVVHRALKIIDALVS